MTAQGITGLEVAQLRTLVDTLTAEDVDPEARIDLALTDAGQLHAWVDHPEDPPRITQLAIDVNAEVLPRVGPDAGVDPDDLDEDDPGDEQR